MPEPQILHTPVRQELMSIYPDDWQSWCADNGRDPGAQRPDDTALYLRSDRHNHKTTILPEIAAAALSQLARNKGLPDPIYSPQVTAAMADMAQHRTDPVVRNPLGLRCLNIAFLAAHHAEGEKARRRALEAALAMMLSRESELFTWELTELTHADIVRSGDHAWIRRGDEEPHPVSTILAETAAQLGHGREDDRVIPVRPQGLTPRIKRLTAAVGLGSAYSHWSGNVGVIQDLLATDDTFRPRADDDEDHPDQESRESTDHLRRHAQRFHRNLRWIAA